MLVPVRSPGNRANTAAGSDKLIKVSRLAQWGYLLWEELSDACSRALNTCLPETSQFFDVTLHAQSLFASAYTRESVHTNTHQAHTCTHAYAPIQFLPLTHSHASMSNIPSIEDLTLLEELDVRGVELDGDVNSLQNLGELRVLKISHTHVFGSLDFVQNMLNLETLYVTPAESGVHCELSALSKLTRLQDVDFTDFNGDHALSGNQSCLDGNLDLLSNLTNLQSLKISHGDVFGSVSSLSHLTNLKTLHMYDTLIDNPDEEEQALLAHLTDWSW